MTYTKQFAQETESRGIRMTLVGQWADLVAYYRGTDGNAWSWSGCTGSWSNEGEYADFVRTFSQRRRGHLFPTQATEIAKGVVEYPDGTMRCNI